jgi:hypothetical protein
MTPHDSFTIAIAPTTNRKSGAERNPFRDRAFGGPEKKDRIRNAMHATRAAIE